MKKLIALLVAGGMAVSAQATIIYNEDFNDAGLDGAGIEGDSNGVTTNLSGVTSFTIDDAGVDWGSDGSLNWLRVESSQMEADDVDGTAIWRTENLDVTAYSSFDASLDFAVKGGGKNSGGDFGFEWGYELDGVFTVVEDIGETAEGDAIDESTIDGTTRSVSGIDLTGVNTLNIRVDLGANGGGDGYQFDNVSVDATAVPEPTTALLFAAALGGMIGLRRRRG